jgi:hypothetical protein
MGKLNDQFLRRNAEMQNKVSQQKQAPLITNSMVKSVSAERRAGLEVEIEPEE